MVRQEAYTSLVNVPPTGAAATLFKAWKSKDFLNNDVALAVLSVQSYGFYLGLPVSPAPLGSTGDDTEIEGAFNACMSLSAAQVTRAAGWLVLVQIVVPLILDALRNRK